MTYTHYVDCAKWKKVIGIGLWITLSVLLAYGIYFTIGLYGTEKQGLYLCHDEYTNMEKFPHETVQTVCEPDYPTQLICIGGTVLMNIVNYVFVWRTLNRHYKWLEIKCGTKPDETPEKGLG